MLPVVPVVLPLFATALLAGLSKRAPTWFGHLVALSATLTTLAVNVYLMQASAAQPIVYWFGNWRPRNGIALGISFAVDPLGAGLAAFASLLTFAALVFSSKYFDSVGNHFSALLLAFLGAMCGFSLTGDLFNLFVFFELMSAAAFALCGYKTDDPGSLQGAINFGVINTIAAYFVLTGIGLVYARTSALNMAQAGRTLGSAPVDALVLIAFVFIACGYLVKAAVAPFHFWLADAHAVAPSPVCVLFSGVMVEMGIFALARIYWAVFDTPFHSRLPGLVVLFISLGVVTALVAAFMCYLQRSVKRLLAFSTVSHVGLMVIGIGLFSPGGLAGTAIYTIGHGLIKGALFLAAGILLHRFQSIDEMDLYGEAKPLRWTAVLFVLGAIGLAGAPFSGVALGHDLVSRAAAQAGYGWIKWMFVIAEAITAAAVLRATARIFLGWGPREEDSEAPKHEEKPETEEGHERIPATMFVPALLMVLAGLSLSLIPALQQPVLAAATRFENSTAYTAHVLSGVPFPASPSGAPAPPEYGIAVLTVAAAFAIAAVHLSSGKTRNVVSKLAAPLRLLHRIHSGHVGDYIVFLTFGMACFGLICAYCVQ